MVGSKSTSRRLKIETLKKRSDFLKLRRAPARGAPAFLLAGRKRGERANGQSENCEDVRVGFTVTKKMGNAVRRNRIRRRLKSAAEIIFPEYGQVGFDYVVIARQSAYTRNFAELLDDMKHALLSLPQTSGKKRQPHVSRPDATRVSRDSQTND